MKTGSKEWWRVVRETQFHEAEAMLRNYRGELLRESEGVPDAATAAEISRINDEIHRISQLQNKASIMSAIRNVYGQEGVDAVREEIARLEFVASHA